MMCTYYYVTHKVYIQVINVQYICIRLIEIGVQIYIYIYIYIYIDIQIYVYYYLVPLIIYLCITIYTSIAIIFKLMFIQYSPRYIIQILYYQVNKVYKSYIYYMWLSDLIPTDINAPRPHLQKSIFPFWLSLCWRNPGPGNQHQLHFSNWRASPTIQSAT